MEIDSILDDDLDVQILEVEPKDECMSIASVSTTKNEPTGNNPVEQGLIKHLHYACNLIDQANSNIQVIQSVTQKILQNLVTQAAYRDNDSSESDSDMYSSTGEPIVKKTKNKFYKKRKVLEVLDVWQRVVDDKWIIGVVVESTTTCLLTGPTLYIYPRIGNGIDVNGIEEEDSSWHGVSAFWALIEDTYWHPTEAIEGEERLVATVCLDLPSFNEMGYVEAHGTIFCEFGDKMFQTPVPSVKLSVEDLVNGSCALDLEAEDKALYSVLALKVSSVDRVVLQPDSSARDRLNKFMKRYDFKEVREVGVARDAGSLQYCLLEIIPAGGTDGKILVTARSEAQLSAVVQLMRQDFPDLQDVERQASVDEAALALQAELQLYLNCSNPAELQRARIKTDLLIP